MLHLITILFLTFSVQQKPTVTVVDKATFADLIASGIPIVDVRRPEEFEAGQIETAKNINFLADDFIKTISQLDTLQPLLIYCRSGNRSGRAAKVMDSLGFKKIYDLEGGYLNWIALD